MKVEWKEAGRFGDIRYETSGDGIAKITINRPEVRNAFRPETVVELREAFQDAREDAQVGVVILTGEGDLAFCSGGDQSVRGHGGYVDSVGVPRLNVLDLQREIRALPKPVIAMVAGYAIGGGHVLHMLCDLTIAADNARFGQTGPRVGSFDALRHYSRAVEADPTFAGAYAGLATTELLLGMSEASDLAEAISRARVLALKAYEMDPELAEAHDILALIQEQLDEGMVDLRPGLDAPEPMSEVRLSRGPPTTSDSVGGGAAAGDSITVISVDPDIVSSASEFRRDSTSISESFTQVGRQLRAASADWASRTGRTGTMDPARMVTAARQFNAAGRTDQAIDVLGAITERSPEHVEAWDALGSLYASTGQFEELLDMRRSWVDNGGGDAEAVDRLEERLRAGGAEGYWEWRLEALQERAAGGEEVSQVYMAAAFSNV